MSTQDRTPIEIEAVSAAVAGNWLVRAVASTGSTNADLVASGPVDRSVLVAEFQTAGRGRLGRSWVAPVGSGLLFSVALWVPGIPAVRRGWVGALLGLALREAVAERTGLQATLKWPNDLLIAGRKCAGILAELAGDSVVVGAGVNVSTTTAELARPDATSLALAGAEDLDRAALLGSTLTAFGRIVDTWLVAKGDVAASDLLEKYRNACSTLGRRVRIELPGGHSVIGIARDVRADGSLVVHAADGATVAFAAGDVVHLRPEHDR